MAAGWPARPKPSDHCHATLNLPQVDSAGNYSSPIANVQQVRHDAFLVPAPGLVDADGLLLRLGATTHHCC